MNVNLANPGARREEELELPKKLKISKLCQSFLFSDVDINRTFFCFVLKKEGTEMNFQAGGAQMIWCLSSISVWVHRSVTGSLTMTVANGDVSLKRRQTESKTQALTWELAAVALENKLRTVSTLFNLIASSKSYPTWNPRSRILHLHLLPTVSSSPDWIPLFSWADWTVQQRPRLFSRGFSCRASTDLLERSHLLSDQVLSPDQDHRPCWPVSATSKCASDVQFRCFPWPCQAATSSLSHR